MQHPVGPSDIYLASYSGTDVYEMLVGSISVMRRKRDSWLNATQLLKVAGIDRGKRMRILDRDIISGPHEKVQGGYGKYQGTWIPFQRARDLCNQYGIEHLIRPLLDLDIDRILAGATDLTPTKEQSMAQRRKLQFYTNPNSFQPYPSSAPLPPSLPHMGVMSHTVDTSPSQPTTNNNNNNYPPPPRPDVPDDDSNNINNNNAKRKHDSSSQPADATTANDQDSSTINGSLTSTPPNIPPRKRTRVDDQQSRAPSMEPTPSANRFMTPPSLYYQRQSPAPEKESSSMSESMPLESLDPAITLNYEKSKEQLTQLFLNSSSKQSQQPQSEDNNNGSSGDVAGSNINYDVPIDEFGHTALHWAAALARIPLVKHLVVKGAHPQRVNYAGETALVRAVLVTNNLDQSSFPELLDLLYPAITIADKQGRNVLHHIALTAGIKGRSSASRYYLECLLEWIVQKGNGCGQSKLGLSKFIANILNAQDKSGDTALNIAARIGNKSIVQQLLEVGADATLANRAGLRPLDFGITSSSASSNSTTTGNNNNNHHHHLALLNNDSNSKNNINIQRSKDIIVMMQETIRQLEGEFSRELQRKQLNIDEVHGHLRDITTKLGKDRWQTENLRMQLNRLVDLQQRGQNLERAIKDEDDRFRQDEAAAAAAAAVAVVRGQVVVSDGDEQQQRGGGGSGGENQSSSTSGVKDENTNSSNSNSSSSTTGSGGGGGGGEGGGSSTVTSATTATTGLGFDGNIDADEPFRAWTVEARQDGSVTESVNRGIPIPVLRARIVAYEKNAAHLNKVSIALRGRSADLENKYRKVVAQCTGVDISKVDPLLEGLLQAIESDPAEVDMTRVAGFLRKIDEESTSD